MSFNVQGAVEVPLEVFAGLVTEMSPSDLPEGVSPDCQDCVFVPGSVSSRPGLKKVFATPFGAVTVNYAKSYVDPTGVIRNLYLSSDGKLWVENVTASPGTYSLLLTSTAGSYAKSITAFGREYIAISNGRNGTDIPLQYDGTNLDRVTQDGPGAPPQVQSIAIPPVSMAAGSVPSPWTITSCETIDFSGSYYTAFQVDVTTSISGLAVGNQVTISGSSNSFFNGVWTVTQLFTATSFKVGAFSGTLQSGTGGTATPTSGNTMWRSNNVVTVNTATPHNLQIGYQAQITGIPAATVGGAIDSIIINNEDLPGIATVTTSEPHGLVPGLLVTLNSIPGVAVGGGISTVSRAGGIVTVTTSSAHGLSAGAEITIAGVTPAGSTDFNCSTAIVSVPSGTTFTYLQDDTDDTGTGGTATLTWPSLQAATPNYYEVQTAPGSNVFQIAINYADGTWSGGNVQYAWDGTFFVSGIPSTTSFQYQQNGPDATSSTVGTVTPFGQASPGQHQMQVAFLTRQGYITRPSPPVTFIANGGQYVSVSDIPIGPSNIVARILLFTGAMGAYFFYIPTAAIVNGQKVSTATQINDNTTTSAVLDFSDNTLFAATAVSIPGNNIAGQITLDGALGFGYYDSRLIAYGQRNTIQNLLNMGFDGGYLPSASTIPTGWTQQDNRGALAPGHYGDGYQISATSGGNSGQIYQFMFEDAYGAPIAQPNTQYRVRFWAAASAQDASVNLVFNVFSASTSYSSVASISTTQMTASGGWFELEFASKTPATIPSDLTLNVYGASTSASLTITVDEISIIYADNPYQDTIAYGSYVNNPEAFDGLTGKFGAGTDTHKLMDFGIVRNTLYMLTEEPSGRLHETIDNGVTEPSGWQVNEVGANCGLLSAFALTKSQADDGTASGGEEWFAWASSSGARIFGGDQPWKISQEIQPDWQAINAAAQGTVWALNDPVERIIYFGLPTGTATTPNLIYPVNYRELDTPYQISMNEPVHTSFSGKLIATDNTRKWCRWNLVMNGAALMYRGSGALSTVFFTGSTFGNVYTLDDAKLTDDDYGQIYPYYVTYFFVNHEAEMALQLGAHMKMLSYLTGQVSGVGNITITPLINKLTNPWPLVGVRQLTTAPRFDLEWAGGSASGQRMAFKIASSPIIGTDNSFQLTKLVAVLKPNTRLPVRGAAA